MPAPAPRTLITYCEGPSAAEVTAPPSTFLAPVASEVHVWFATLASLRPRMAAFHELLDPVELDRAARFRSAQDRERFILGHGLLRSLLGSYMERDGSLIRLARGPFGKPFLERKDLRFNMSDTKDAILIAFAHQNEIGADIETMKRSVDHINVAEHYFTPTEVRSIHEANTANGPEQGKRRFLDLWTRKEAVLKASGVGIMDDLKALRVDGEKNAMLIEHEAFARMAAPEYLVRTYHVGADHLISLASPDRAVNAQLWNAAP